MARWSEMAQPDDPLRDDNGALVRDEDVLVDAAAEDSPVDAASDGAAQNSAVSGDFGLGRAGLDEATSVVDLGERPTTELPRVVETTPPPAQRSWTAGLAPWAVFAAVAVLVITATTTWAAWLQGPTANRQTATPRLDPVPTLATSAPPSPEAVDPPPAAEPEPEPEPEPVARPTQRQRPTRAPAPPPPPEEPPPPPPEAVADADAADTPEESAQEEPQSNGNDSDELDATSDDGRAARSSDSDSDTDDDDDSSKSEDDDDDD